MFGVLHQLNRTLRLWHQCLFLNTVADTTRNSFVTIVKSNIQKFPDTWNLCIKMNQRWKQISTFRRWMRLWIKKKERKCFLIMTKLYKKKGVWRDCCRWFQTLFTLSWSTIKKITWKTCKNLSAETQTRYVSWKRCKKKKKKRDLFHNCLPCPHKVSEGFYWIVWNMTQDEISAFVR